MARKDWKKQQERSGITWWYNPKKNISLLIVPITLSKTVKISTSHRVFLLEDKTNKKIFLKEFDAIKNPNYKSQALAYAKAYMRKH